ncbi:hypothetical protein EVAR_14916_1 [Eumeta japonica]|uniref:Uncharacterized protein n=1 Tax=Eumeta variegata TaxID=151549 RepID=A0A4C1XLL7_EUMVA|nr:hypothetical protein EVAR_14916_1 [Eumeta japonica]
MSLFSQILRESKQKRYPSIAYEEKKVLVISTRIVISDNYPDYTDDVTKVNNRTSGRVLTKVSSGGSLLICQPRGAIAHSCHAHFPKDLLFIITGPAPRPP